jgi:hypothetical protein
MLKYLFDLLISIDQFFNTLLGGDPDMTISRRLGLWLNDGTPWKHGIATVVCYFLSKIDPNHCQDAKE